MLAAGQERKCPDRRCKLSRMRPAMNPSDQPEIPQFLRDRGFRVVQQPGDSLRAGDCPVVLESDQLRLRFDKNGGVKEAQVASLADPDRWWTIPEVLNAIAQSGTNRSPELEALAKSVQQQLPPGFQALVARLRDKRRWAEERPIEERALQNVALGHGVSSQAPLVNGVPLNEAALESEPPRNLRRFVRAVIWTALALILVYLFARR